MHTKSCTNAWPFALEFVVSPSIPLISTLPLVFSDYLWQRVPFVIEDHLLNPTWRYCFDTFAMATKWKNIKKTALPQFDKPRYIWRSHPFCYNNRCSFHLTSPVLFSHRDERHLGILLFPLSPSFSSSLQIVHSSLSPLVELWYWVLLGQLDYVPAKDIFLK